MKLPIEEAKKIILQNYNNRCRNIKYDNKILYLEMPEQDYNLYSYYNYIQTNQRLYTLNDIKNTNNIYTYILYQRKNTKTNKTTYHFVARPVYSILESFSKHYSILVQIVIKEFGIQYLYERLKKENNNIDIQHYIEGFADRHNINIVLAGEIKMKGSNRVEYNFSSGTFMRERFFDLDDETIRHYAIMFEQIMEDIGFNGGFVYNENIQDTFIHKYDMKEEIDNIWSKMNKNELPNFLLFDTMKQCNIYNKCVTYPKSWMFKTLYERIIDNYKTIIENQYIDNNERITKLLVDTNYNENLKEKVNVLRDIIKQLKRNTSEMTYNAYRGYFQELIDIYDSTLLNCDTVHYINLFETRKQRQIGGNRTKRTSFKRKTNKRKRKTNYNKKTNKTNKTDKTDKTNKTDKRKTNKRNYKYVKKQKTQKHKNTKKRIYNFSR